MYWSYGKKLLITLERVLFIHGKRTIGVREIFGIEELMICRIEVSLQFRKNPSRPYCFYHAGVVIYLNYIARISVEHTFDRKYFNGIQYA